MKANNTTAVRRPHLGQKCEIIEVATTSAGRTLYGLKLAGQTGCHRVSWDDPQPLVYYAMNFQLRILEICDV
jgi:hypothetical protein